MATRFDSDTLPILRRTPPALKNAGRTRPHAAHESQAAMDAKIERALERIMARLQSAGGPT